MVARVLAVAGSDPSGGAGIQADLKTITALGGYGAAAITALTAQDTMGVHRVVLVDPDFVAEQTRLVLDDIGADAVKIGMLGTRAVAERVSDEVRAWADRIPIVVDPILLASDGTPLLGEGGVEAVRNRLLPIAALVTPNLAEAEALVGASVRSETEMIAAARRLVELGASAALVTGGHLEGEIFDVLVTRQGLERRFDGERLSVEATHGTGCTLSTAIATGLAEGESLETAIEHARAFVRAAMIAAPRLGRGKGPLFHAGVRKG